MKKRFNENSYESGDAGEGDDEGGDEFGDVNHSPTTEARTRHSFLAEDQGVVDADDENLSELFASMGVEERLDELGL